MFIITYSTIRAVSYTHLFVTDSELQCVVATCNRILPTSCSALHYYVMGTQRSHTVCEQLPTVRRQANNGLLLLRKTSVPVTVNNAY